jgi:hypothetical protein
MLQSNSSALTPTCFVWEKALLKEISKVYEDVSISIEDASISTYTFRISFDTTFSEEVLNGLLDDLDNCKWKFVDNCIIVECSGYPYSC